MTLAMKSTIVTSVTIAVLMSVFGFVAYSTSKSALNREIDTFGVSLARALALPDVSWWRSSHGSFARVVQRILSSRDEYAEYLQEAFGITVARERPPADSLSEAAREQRERIERELQRTKARNLSRLARLTRYGDEPGSPPSEILDAFILDPEEDKSLVRANPDARAFRPTSGERPYVVEFGGKSVRTPARVIEGRFDEGPARSYSYPIRDEEGNVTHRAYVFLSEASIQQRLNSLLSKIVLCTLAFILVGALVTFLLTRQMTLPLTDLVHDIEIVSRGNFQHRTIARTRDEIGLLARTFDRMVRSLAEARSEQSEHRALKHEVAVASEVQGKLLPERIPEVPGYELDVLRLATGDLGGGYYDFLELPGGDLAIVVADGSGQGVPAAMNVVMTRTLLRSEGEHRADPEEILERANAALSRDIRKGMYVSTLFAVLRPAKRRLEVCGAGQVSLLLYRAASGELEVVVPDGIALGFDPGPVFERSLRVAPLELEEGDRVVLVNSALAKIENDAGEPLGEERLRAVVRKLAPRNTTAFLNLLDGAIHRFRKGTPLTGDVIVVTLAVGRRESSG